MDRYRFLQPPFFPFRYHPSPFRFRSSKNGAKTVNDRCPARFSKNGPCLLRITCAERQEKIVQTQNPNIEKTGSSKQWMYRDILGKKQCPRRILYVFRVKNRIFSIAHGTVIESIPCNSMRAKDFASRHLRQCNVTSRMANSLQHFEQNMFLLSDRPFLPCSRDFPHSLQL